MKAARRRLLSGLTVFALLLGLPTLLGTASAAPGGWSDPPNGYPEWNNNIPTFEVGAEPPHATLMPYAGLGEALGRRPYALSVPPELGR